MNTKFFGESNKNKFIKELKKVLGDFASKEEVDKIVNSIGQADGIASLDGSGKVPSEQLPSYVDDIIEVEDYAHLPEEGETGKIYITLDNGNQYRWSGSTYVPLNANNIEGDGVKKIIKLSRSEYDALETKDPLNIYIVYNLANGVYIIYNDYTYSNYNTVISGKTPLGILLKTDKVCFIINPTTRASSKKWTNNSTLITGITTTESYETAQSDYNGESNTLAMTSSGNNAPVFKTCTNIGDGWYLPAVGEYLEIRSNVNNINIGLNLIHGRNINFNQSSDNNKFWASTQCNDRRAYLISSVVTQALKITESSCIPIKKFNANEGIQLYLGSILIADSNFPNEIEQLLASI